MLIEANWSILSHQFLLNVFKLLDDKDRVSASATCRHWRKVFMDPILWRSKEFDYYEVGSSPRELDGLTKYVQVLGQFAQHVSIYCCQRNDISPESLAYSIQSILEELSRKGTSTIETFKLCDLHFGVRWRTYDFTACVLVHSLAQFLNRQKNIRDLSLCRASMTQPYGLMVVSSLSESPSTNTLESISLHDYYCYASNVMEERFSFKDLVKNSRHLAEIRLNYYCLGQLGLDFLCQCLKNSLRHLFIYVSIPVATLVGGLRFMNSDMWKKCKLKCPALKVSFFSIDGVEDIIPLLVDGMPLVRLVLRYTFNNQHPEQHGEKASAMMDHLSQKFSQSLESVKLSMKDNDADTALLKRQAVVDCLVKCPNMRKLRLAPTFMTPELVEEIQSELPEHDPRRVIKILQN